MWKSIGRALGKGRIGSQKKYLLPILALGISLSSYLTYRNLKIFNYNIPEQQTNSCEGKANVLHVPSTLSEFQIELISDVFPNLDIKLSDKLQNTLLCLNSVGECKQISLADDILLGKQWIFHLSNFMNPPHVVQQKDFDNTIHNLIENQNIILAYFPKQSTQQQKQYRGLKYISTSSNNTYLIVRDKNLAKALELKQGSIFLLTSKNKHSDNNFLYKNQSFAVSSIPSSQNIQDKKKFILNHTLNQFNFVYNQGDLDNFIRSVRASDSSLVFYLGIDQVNSKELEVLLDAFRQFKKKISDTKIHFLFSKSKGLLKKKLKIQENPMSIESRLFDLNKYQPICNIFQNYKIKGVKIDDTTPSVVSRRKYQSGLEKQQFQKFLKENKQEYYEEKEVKNIQPLRRIQKGIKGIVLIYKNQCPGCMLVGNVLQNVQNMVEELKINGPRSKEFIQKYKITNPQKLQNLKIYRFHTLNQDSDYPLEIDYTPQIHIFTEKGNKLIKLKQEASINDVHLQIIKQVCEQLS